uniref:Putative secreted protein n=1 Tax=Anopheles marajoara TaxID=58244 RepID=A0A2M4CDJ2_9DIPT
MLCSVVLGVNILRCRAILAVHQISAVMSSLPWCSGEGSTNLLPAIVTTTAFHLVAHSRSKANAIRDARSQKL